MLGASELCDIYRHMTSQSDRVSGTSQLMMSIPRFLRARLDYLRLSEQLHSFQVFALALSLIAMDSASGSVLVCSSVLRNLSWVLFRWMTDGIESDHCVAC